MTELSPAAQAMLNAYRDADIEDEASVAAVLRAAVAHTQVHQGQDIWKCDADELLAIADELEAH